MTTRIHWTCGHLNGDDESYSEEPDWTENFYETDEYYANESTFSQHIPALLDQLVETQDGDASKLETVHEAVAAANAPADMSRRSWTQARQLMKDVHRSRGHSPVSTGNHMEVDHGKGKSRGKKVRSNTGKGKHRGKSKGKGKRRRPGPCLLCQGLHRVRGCPSHHGGKGKRATSFGNGSKNSSPFRQAYLEDRSRCFRSLGAISRRILSVLTLTGNLFSTLEPHCPWEASIFYSEFRKSTQMPVFDRLHVLCHHFFSPS